VQFWVELQRRHVIRIVLAYLVVAWILVQVAVAIQAPLGLPGRFSTLVIVLLAIGFPIVSVLAWAFDITVDGIKRTPPPQAQVELATQTAPIEPAPAVTAPLPAADPRSIAVLPFVNMSSDPDQEYFSDGLSEELLNVLSQIENLRVIARTSCFAFKGKNADVREISRQLGVAHVLEGSVRKSGDRLRITAQLIDAADGGHLWSQTYDRELQDVFAIQDEIARAVAGALSITLGVGEATAETGRTEDLETYDLYLRARAQISGFGPDDFARAADLFRQAVASDPGFSRARAGFVYASFLSGIYVPERRVEAKRTLEQTVAEARARAPDDWATHFAVALLHYRRGEWADAERAFERVMARAPESVPEVGELRGNLLLNIGRAADALAILKETMSSDPLSVNRSFLLQFVLDMLGRHDEAEAEYQRSRDLPGADAREDMAHWALMRVWNGADAALIESRFDTFLSRQTIHASWNAEVRAVYDDPAAALAIIRAAYEDDANRDHTRLLFISAYAAHYGDAELALAVARSALVDLRGRAVNILWWPDMASVRRLPGFKELVRDIGLVDYWRTTGKWGDFARPVGDDDFECL
jgi:adenylate cyclase